MHRSALLRSAVPTEATNWSFKEPICLQEPGKAIGWISRRLGACDGIPSLQLIAQPRKPHAG